VGRKVRCRGLV